MPVSIRGQFQRSVQLVRDFYGPRDLSGYVVTSKAVETTARLADALATPGSTRSWSMSGPYGGGKSSYVLFASRLLRGDAEAAEKLSAVDVGLSNRLAKVSGGAFCPVLVVGSRGPVLKALADGLARALGAFAADVPEGKGRASSVEKTARALAGEAHLATTEAEVLAVYDRAADLVHGRTGGGLFLVIDELGKHLEYAALHPADGDLFVLQSLAERAARADAAPLLVVTVVHQAVERYATGVSSKQRDDWRKVQGRFEEVAFVEPEGEALRLLAEAVDAELDLRIRKQGDRAVRAVLKASSLPARLDPDAVAERLRQSLPLSPAVALLVGPLFRRLAQNERSLFSFLASGEPSGFLDIVGSGEEPFYRLDHLYDYLTGALGGALYQDGAGQLWAETEGALNRVAGDELQARLLKQIAVLSFAGTLAGLPPTEAVLVASSGTTVTKTREALVALRNARAVAYRPFRDEYRVWEGSDFDLAAALAEARAEIPLHVSLADLLAQAAPPSALVARRHAFETGTTRVFDVAYTDENGWGALLDAPTRRADGRIVYVLPEGAPPAGVVDQILEATAGRYGLHLFCVPSGVAGLRDLARDVAALDWVRDHYAALEGDKVARREVEEQRTDLRATLDHRLAATLTADDGVWVRSGERVLVDTEGGLQPVLSDACDEVFARTPRVWNELLNRRSPSSSAVRAQKLLLQAMTDAATRERLGIEGTPAEYGLYVSVLRQTGLHQEVAPGTWAFVDPGDHAGVDPGAAAVIHAIAEAIRGSCDGPVVVPDLYDLARQPPYGVRDGLLPVFLFAVLLRLGDEVAVFEDGVYQWALSYEAVERLLRGPRAFSVQYVGASDAQRAVLAVLAPRVGLPATEDLKPLPVVGRILQAISGLPAFVRKTASLSDTTTAVREALVQATEPSGLLFRDLPAALGLDPFGVGDATATVRQQANVFADGLADALRQLGSAYDDLLEAIGEDLHAAFDLRGPSVDARRVELAARARALADDAVDPTLRSFVVRAADDLAEGRAWLESLAALLARTPPAQWADGDRARFASSLQDVARLFLNREAVSFPSGGSPSDRARTVTRFRLSVTATHEEERQTVVDVHPEDLSTVHDLTRRVSDLLEEGGISLNTQIAALSHLSLALLERRAGRAGTLEEILSALRAPSDNSPDHA